MVLSSGSESARFWFHGFGSTRGEKELDHVVSLGQDSEEPV